MSEWLQREWGRTSLWQVLLRPFSWLFLLLSSVRRAAYQSGLFKTYSLQIPVVVVGNITVGGTGKSPLVIWLAQQFRAAGFQPGIISRGYGGKHTSPVSVTGYSDPAVVGDEPVMIAARTGVPVFVGRDRVAAGKLLVQAHPECDVIITDDGLQHYRLARDAEVVVIDGARGFGNGQLLPAGPLREPAGRLKSVDAVVCNRLGCVDGAFEMKLRPTVFRNLKDVARTADAAYFAGKNMLAIAGIGNPGRFFAQLKAMGLESRARTFSDHHVYTVTDLQSDAADVILMTEKDAVKCRDFAGPEWWYLEVEADVDRNLFECVLNKLRK